MMQAGWIPKKIKEYIAIIVTEKCSLYKACDVFSLNQKTSVYRQIWLPKSKQQRKLPVIQFLLLFSTLKCNSFRRLLMITCLIGLLYHHSVLSG